MGNTDKFDRIANKYDTPERVQLAKVVSDAIRDYLVDSKSKEAIDFGCGTGLIGMNLLNDFKSILFLDTSQKMINQVEQKITDLNIKNGNTLCFDFEKDSLSSLSVDYIFMSQVLLHIKEFKPVLLKLFDSLKHDGHLIIVDFNKNLEVDSDMVHNGFDQVYLVDILSQIGLKFIQSKTFYKGKKLFMGQNASLFILDAKRVKYEQVK